jgi:hypothetical protein
MSDMHKFNLFGIKLETHIKQNLQAIFMQPTYQGCLKTKVALVRKRTIPTERLPPCRRS